MSVEVFTALCAIITKRAQGEFAAAQTAEQLESLRVKYLGRNGLLRELRRML